MVGFEKALGAVKVTKDQIQYRFQSLLNLARGYFSPATSKNNIIFCSHDQASKVLENSQVVSITLGYLNHKIGRLILGT